MKVMLRVCTASAAPGVQGMDDRGMEGNLNTTRESQKRRRGEMDRPGSSTDVREESAIEVVNLEMEESAGKEDT